MLPLDRLMVREVSPRLLSQDERIEIADLRRAGYSIRQIATERDRSPSTISRELRRNAASSDRYQPFQAHRRATARRERRHRRRIIANELLGLIVTELLAQRWSPQQISRHLRGGFPPSPGCGLPRENLPCSLPARIASHAGLAPPISIAYRP